MQYYGKVVLGIGVCHVFLYYVNPYIDWKRFYVKFEKASEMQTVPVALDK